MVKGEVHVKAQKMPCELRNKLRNKLRVLAVATPIPLGFSSLAKLPRDYLTYDICAITVSRDFLKKQLRNSPLSKRVMRSRY